jgi:hypothetical protein
VRLSKTSRGRLERGAVLAATVGLHAVVLFLLTRPVTPDFPDHSNDEDAIDITLDRARRPARAAGRTEAPSSAPHRPVLIAPGAVETAAIAPALAAPTAGPAPPASGSGARGDLGAALRTGGLACSGDLRKMLGPEERARCDERFGALARNAPDLPAPIDPGKRAYYDAIAEAYRDHGPVVPLTARGAGGIFGAEEGVQVGHGPRVGCSVKFGPNASKAPKGPANALRAGPCFIQPPLGSLTPEADIRKPY